MTSEELLKKFQKLAEATARRYTTKFPKHKDDLKSAALEGMCHGIRIVISQKKFEYAGAIIYLNIRRYLFEELKKIPLIYLPTSYIKKARLKALNEKRPFKISEIYPIIFNDPDFSIISKISYNGFYALLLKESIEDLQLSKFEKDVLSLRLEERAIRQIAEELNCSKSKIQKTIEKIRERWRKKSGI
jgi:DNA-directed RNA polymerase specialized sigma subunit